LSRKRGDRSASGGDSSVVTKAATDGQEGLANSTAQATGGAAGNNAGFVSGGAGAGRICVNGNMSCSLAGTFSPAASTACP
jgi:hypothetical protein